MAAFTQTDQEAIFLNLVWEMIDDMVNYELFVKTDQIQDTNLVLHTSSHQRLFNILLGDFLSQPGRWGKNSIVFDLPNTPHAGREVDRTNLYYLRGICDAPKLGSDTENLRGKIDSFMTWLDTKANVPNVWLPSISVKLDLQIKRIVFIKICGNIGKHSLTRLNDNATKMGEMLKEHGHPIEEAQGGRNA